MSSRFDNDCVSLLGQLRANVPAEFEVWVDETNPTQFFINHRKTSWYETFFVTESDLKIGAKRAAVFFSDHYVRKLQRRLESNADA